MEIPLTTDPTWFFVHLEVAPSNDVMHVGTYKGFGPGSRTDLEIDRILSGFYNTCIQSLDHQCLDGLSGLQNLAMSVHLGDIDFKSRKIIYYKFTGANDRYSQVDFYWHLTDFNGLPSTEVYGIPFSEQVYDRLKTDGYYCQMHRDYCGIGLFYHEGSITVGEVNEGELLTALIEFTDKESFVKFFATQSDLSMSRCDRTASLYTDDPKYQHNQTLDKKSLISWLAESSSG